MARRSFARAIQERDFSSIDLTLFICPFTVLAIIRVLLGTIFAACGFISWSSQGAALFNWMLGVVSSMVFMMVLAGLTMVVERKQIGASNRELFAYALSFPIYILSYVPISFQAVFAKAPVEADRASGLLGGRGSAYSGAEPRGTRHGQLSSLSIRFEPVDHISPDSTNRLK